MERSPFPLYISPQTKESAEQAPKLWKAENTELFENKKLAIRLEMQVLTAFQTYVWLSFLDVAKYLP
jgi:hypothetical protein